MSYSIMSHYLIRMATLSESSTNISHTSSSVVKSRGVVALLPTLL